MLRLWIFFTFFSLSSLQQQHCDKKQTLKIGAFNVQNYGPSKVKNADVMRRLSEIVLKYDAIFLQEVQDKKGKSIPVLLESVNKLSRSRKEKGFEMVVSQRVGRTSNEAEQYLLLYRPNRIGVLKTETFHDPGDAFSRDPFMVHLLFDNSSLSDMVVVVLHAKPDATSEKLTVKEISELASVSDYLKTHWRIKNVLFMGDFNAGGNYVRKSDWPKIELWTRSDFKWLMGNKTDTTVSQKNQEPYDRIVISGTQMSRAIVPGSAAAYRFDEDPSIGGKKLSLEEALQVSDHYPVEVKICPYI